ncbi:uncharacterized protein LOC132557540 [Ylistrum balloti]|uniref:uncharacterized protein LOC132557540 n=1 Tax=Ylistrum balloti TaxID=509963 RepID=UPI002905B26B|nr:uncharacterized protein LOC132557540 [Ylistrum balloti]
MASILLMATPTEKVSFSDSVTTGDGKICPSPMSTFGSDVMDNLYLHASNAGVFVRTDYSELASKATNNLQRLEGKYKKRIYKMINNTDDNLDEDEDTDEVINEIVTIAVFATNMRKNDIQCEKDKYHIKIKREVNIKKHKKKNVKKQKRKNVAEDFGFLNVSLFPRPCHVPEDNDESALERFYAVEQSLNDFEDLVAPYEKELDIEGRHTKMDKHLRSDKDRKKTKAHIQVKDKYCKSVKNNGGRKKLFVHHRVYKLMELEIQRLSYMPSPKRATRDLQREEMKAIKHTPVRPAYNPHFRPAPRGGIQNLAYAIDNNNAAQDLDSALVNVLITLQHRDLTPEDYETLLRLDENVAPKTLQKDVLESFRTDIVNESGVHETCSICMDQYTIGQSRKFLPCNHVFHTNCIDMWLENSSLNCPIDNLPVSNS